MKELISVGYTRTVECPVCGFLGVTRFNVAKETDRAKDIGYTIRWTCPNQDCKAHGMVGPLPVEVLVMWAELAKAVG